MWLSTTPWYWLSAFFPFTHSPFWSEFPPRGPMSEDPETRYCMPYFFEDKTGSITGTEFIDLNDRMKLLYRRRQSSASANHEVYEIYDTSCGRFDWFDKPKITLTFGRDHSLGTVGFGAGGETAEYTIRMETYLRVVNAAAGSRVRGFFASDGNEYRWGWRLADNEWTVCSPDAETQMW